MSQHDQLVLDWVHSASPAAAAAAVVALGRHLAEEGGVTRGDFGETYIPGDVALGMAPEWAPEDDSAEPWPQRAWDAWADEMAVRYG